MTAQEMFEELGYEIYYTLEDVAWNAPMEYIHHDGLIIGFDLDDRVYYYSEHLLIDTSIELHKAIHQQMKELGWIK